MHSCMGGGAGPLKEVCDMYMSMMSCGFAEVT